MTPEERLTQLLEMRRVLMRELGRLDVLIASEEGSGRRVRQRRVRELTWEDALHEAKVPLPGEPVLPG